MTYALANKGIVSLRKSPERESALEDEALYGMKVLITAQDEDWYKVMTHYRYTGYVKGEDLLFREDRIEAWNQAKKMVVMKSYADILDIPKYQGIILISVPRGAILALAESEEAQAGDSEETRDDRDAQKDKENENIKKAKAGNEDLNGFTKVMLGDGRYGYVRTSFLADCYESMYEDTYPYHRAAGIAEGDNVRKFLKEQYGISEEKFRDQVIKTALSYLGTQYRWGGKSSLGIDCSGLCSMSYMMNGLIIYRDAKIMEGFPVKAIPLEEAKKGDLLYFPGHIAMYLGKGRFVHSTGRAGDDGVVMGSFIKGEADYRPDLEKILITAGTVF